MTSVDPPVQADRIETGSIGSVKVYTIVSPASARPAVPPPTFVVWTSAAAGAVLSTVTLEDEDVELPAVSVAVTLTVVVPAARGLLAVCRAVR